MHGETVKGITRKVSSYTTNQIRSAPTVK